MMNLVTKITFFLAPCIFWVFLNGVSLKASGISLLIIISSISYLLSYYVGILPLVQKFKPSFILYIFWLLREILKSTFDVLKIVWSRDMRLSENMDWLDTNTSDESFLTIYGNSITLTPGTVTLDIKNNMILVHSLRKASFDDLEKGEMENKIKGVLQLNSDSPKEEQ